MSGSRIDLEYTTHLTKTTRETRQVANLGPYRIVVQHLSTHTELPETHTETLISVTLLKETTQLAYAVVDSYKEAHARATEWIALEEGWIK